MSQPIDGDAIVYCHNAFNTPNGKTAHGLVRFTRRYRVSSVIDAAWAGADAGEVLDGVHVGIPVVRNLEEALADAHDRERRPTHFVIGLAPDGGRLPDRGRSAIVEAIAAGLHVDSGLHDFLSEDPELADLARTCGVTLRDVRKPPPRSALHFFTGAIEDVRAMVVAVLGTDSAVGKRTTAWKLVEGFGTRGIRAEMVGTGQTAWMQGARYGVVLDTLVNDFVSGELEHAAVSAWREARPDVLVIEGQGSLMNPAYPGGFEILAATRPDVVVLQHAPARRDYDGFPGYPIHPIETQIQAIELVSGKPVVALAVNHEDLAREEVREACDRLSRQTGLPCCDPLLDGVAPLIDAVLAHRGARHVHH
jgi:uncharacterized NAD-dependent epimerase/dehydratase family protein